MELKQCTKCKRVFPNTTEYFFRQSKGKDGLQTQCKECMGKRFVHQIHAKEGYKICSVCHRELPEDNVHFYRANKIKSGFSSKCKECHGKEFKETIHFDDITNKKFGKLTVIKLDRKENNRSYWECICECGKTTIVEKSKLKSGHTISCGCARGKCNITHHMTRTRPYRIWRGMLQRCYYEKAGNYERYGAKGIVVCDKWHSFEGFWEDMQGSYKDNLTLDRIDSTKNYCNENCKWSTTIEQANNQCTNRILIYNGQSHTMAEWSRILNIKYAKLQCQLNKGLSIDEAIKYIKGKCS